MYIEDILDAIAKIEEYMQGLTSEMVGLKTKILATKKGLGNEQKNN